MFRFIQVPLLKVGTYPKIADAIEHVAYCRIRAVQSLPAWIFTAMTRQTGVDRLWFPTHTVYAEPKVGFTTEGGPFQTSGPEHFG